MTKLYHLSLKSNFEASALKQKKGEDFDRLLTLIRKKFREHQEMLAY